MSTVVRKVQESAAIPLSIDSPDVAMLRAGLEAYDADRGGGKPTLNSISALRTEGLALSQVQPCRVILLVTEQKVGSGEGKPCRTAQESYETAKDLFVKAMAHGFTPDDVIFDPGIMPVGADTEGLLRRTIETLRLIHDDPELTECHASVGLSNFTVMLPKRRPSGEPIRSTLESAFLTLAMPLGLDMVIGSVKRKYELLPPDHPAMECLEDCLKLSGFEVIMRVREFYA
jgi:5-methyltetrahydrofolate--homocysteine methyltransferase